jgi:hypothetical protein
VSRELLFGDSLVDRFLALTAAQRWTTGRPPTPSDCIQPQRSDETQPAACCVLRAHRRSRRRCSRASKTCLLEGRPSVSTRLRTPACAAKGASRRQGGRRACASQWQRPHGVSTGACTPYFWAEPAVRPVSGQAGGGGGRAERAEPATGASRARQHRETR